MTSIEAWIFVRGRTLPNGKELTKEAITEILEKYINSDTTKIEDIEVTDVTFKKKNL